MTSDDEAYIHFQECLTSLNRSWAILEKLESTDLDATLRSASYRMALIEYAKPFKESRGANRRRHALSLPQMSQDDTKLHARLITLRDQVLAHSDLTASDSTVYVGNVDGQQLPLIVSNTAPQFPKFGEVRQHIENLLDFLYKQIPMYQEKVTGGP